MGKEVYHVLICESDLDSLQMNKEYVKQFSEELEREVQIYTCQSVNGELQNMFDRGYSFDMVILEALLQDGDGIQLAQRLQKKKPSIPIIFITSMEQYRIRASEILALGLLGKPVNREQFRLLFQRAVAQLDMEEKHENLAWLEFQINKRAIGVNMKTIISMEKNQKKVCLKTEAGVYEFRDTLSSIEQKLPSYFLRISQSVIVNLNEVICIEGNQVFTSAHDDFIIGRTYQKTVDVRYRRYWR